MRILLTLIFLLFSSNAQAQVNWSRYDHFANVGGLNNSSSPVTLKANEASDLQNVVFTTSGRIKTRDGFAKVNSSTVGATTVCNGGKFFKQNDGSRFLVAIFDDDTIMKMDYDVGGGPDGTWDDITGALSFTVDQDNLANFAIGEDTLLAEDGLDSTAPYTYSGSGNAAALGGSPPNASMITYHKRHAFAAGNDSNPSILYFSDLGDIANWTTGTSGNVEVETNDGTKIRAIHPGFDALYIWKDTSIWRLTGDDKDTFELQRMVRGIGTESQNSVALVGNDFIFTDGKGDTYIYDGAVKLRLLSANVQGTIDDQNFDRFDESSVIEFDKDYYWTSSTAGASDHNTLLMFDTFHLSWTKFSGINANAMWVGEDSNGKDALFFGDYTGFVYQYPSGTNDAGTAISAYYTTKQFRFKEVNINKTLRVLNVLVSQEGNYNLDVESRTDFQSTGSTKSINLQGESSVYGTSVFGTDKYGGQNLITGRLEFDQEGQFFQFKFSNSNIDEPIEIEGWQPFIDESDRI